AEAGPLGTQAGAGDGSTPRCRRARRTNAWSMAVDASRSAMTPSRSGWTISTSWGSLPDSASAASPTAATLPLSLSMAIAEGSSMIRPRPPMWIRLLTVPRSIATPVRNRIESRPQHEMPVSPPPVWLLIQGCGSSGAEVTEVGARLGRGRREPGVVAPGGHGGHVGAGLALEFLPRG